LAFRAVHTADIHLDSPLRSLALRNEELANLIGNATRRAFKSIIDLCIEEKVDALFIAGDLLDGEQTSMKTAKFIAEQSRRLNEAGILEFKIKGNHDALCKITPQLECPPGTKVFTGRAEAVEINRPHHPPIAVHGLSYTHHHAPESLLPKYKQPLAGFVNIGMMHTSAGGAEGHDVYAPCNLRDLHESGFAYWALGHEHKRWVDTAGRAQIVMPGMPQGRDIGESGPKGVTLLTIHDDGSITHEERLTCVAQFERLPVDVEAVEDWSEVIDCIERALEAACSQTRAEHLVARIELKGRTSLSWRIRRDHDLLVAEAEMRGRAIGSCWLDKLTISCRDVDAGDAKSDPVAELSRIVETDVISSPAFRAQFAQMAKDLKSQLPAECRDALGADEADAERLLVDLAREGSRDVLARLRSADGAA
jgi:exonuclease SbcD